MLIAIMIFFIIHFFELDSAFNNYITFFSSMAAHVQSGLATGSEGLVCFVCDVGVVGRYYALATCRTQTTKVRLIEKLGQLVGDE